jgi:hypothetical protein
MKHEKRKTEHREVPTRTVPDMPPLELPSPPNGWSVFRRSGRIQEPERFAVLTIQEEHPDLQKYSSGLLVEAYRRHKRKHAKEIAVAAGDSL